MRYFIAIAAIVLAVLLLAKPDASGIQLITLAKSEFGWTVTYSLSEPTDRLMFVRSPDRSRSERWQPLDSNVAISWQDGNEVVTTRNGEPFDEVSFALDATYVPLPKDYAPFSPFSNGGMLVHTGRFFACANTCTANHHEWPMAMQLPTDDYLLINGTRQQGFFEWLDRDSGRAIYVGKQPPEHFAALVTLIDPALPQSLQYGLVSELPMIMSYFTKQLGSLTQTPMLFASYGDYQGGYYGQQGGVLPNQIFMHWYGEASLENINEETTLWFFAHEIAHLFQGSGLRYSSTEEAWIHEGAAEMMAYLYTDSKLGQSSDLLSTAVQEAQQKCTAAWPISETFVAVGKVDFRTHYTCGLVANAELHAQLKANGIDAGIFTLWQTYSDLIQQGEPANSTTYFAAFKQLTGYASMTLRQLIDRPVSMTIAP
jgi:hypothetical protein